MRRQKRDLCERAFKRGYLAGQSGKSKENCPVQSIEVRQEWMNGWREGRSDHWDGYTGVSGIHKIPSIQ